MLKEIIEHINTQIDGLGIFDKIYGLCEQIQEFKTVEGAELEQSYPAEYQKGGELDKVNVEVNRSVLWSRRNGEGSTDSNDDFEVGCRTSDVLTIPISYLGSVIRCGEDNAYKQERVITDIINTIKENDNRDLVATINADSLSIQPEAWSSLRTEILAEEFPGSRMKLPYSTALFRIDLVITVEIDSACFELSECTCDG